jgi:beta-glucosidase
MDPKSLLAQLTLEEKAALCCGAGPWTTAEVARLEVPRVFVADGPHGVRRVVDEHAMAQTSLPSTDFPTAVSLASSWDTALVREVGEAIGREAAAQGVDVVLGPGANIKRTPLGGRNFEYFSEDPYLAGEMAVAWIDGVQSRGVGASLKHFALNNQEFQRNVIDAVADERTLRELYLPAFETAVRRARPWTVMTAYNKVNGALCAQNAPLLTDILKQEWDYQGVVVSDWGAVRERVASLAAGLDLEMPGPRPRGVRRIVDAVGNGELDVAVLDDAVLRLLRLAARASHRSAAEEPDAAAHHALARRAAADGMVLLSNDGTLPLDGRGTLAVIGRSAEHPHTQGGGSSHINPTRVDIPLEALAAAAPDAEVRYAEGWGADLSPQPERILAAVELARRAEVALVFVALPGSIESEGYDRTELGLPPAQVALIRQVAAAQPRTVVVLNSGGAVDVSPWVDEVAAVLQGWTMGQGGGGALADVLLGRVNPSGKLAETYPLRLEDTPAYLSYPGENGRAPYTEGLFVGYRYYDARGVPVRFGFGHGLSYTRFAYAELEPAAPAFDDGDVLRVAFTVTNRGERAGKEVAQLYVRDVASRLRRPVKELKGFAKVALEPGESKRVTLALDRRAFAYWDPAYGRWVAEAGEFELLVGASATDIRLRATVTMRQGTALPCILRRESTIREWLADERGRAVLEPLMDAIVGGLRAGMGAAEEGAEFIGMDLMGFLMDMPLLNVLSFDQSEDGPTAEERVDAMLAAAHADGAALHRKELP